MLKIKVAICAAALSLAVGAHAQGNFATGNMKFDAKAMDANGDNMISKDEFMAYGEKMWGSMTKGSSTISVKDAAQAFARGNMNFSAKAMDTDHDGTISKDEFMKYGEAKFDKMKDANGMISVDDAWKDFARGNMHPKTHTKAAKKAS